MEVTSDRLLLRDVIALLEQHYPPDTAADWDRVGLVTGDPEQPVRRILLAVDPTLAVIDEAAQGHYDLLVTHHPLLLRGVHSVATTSAKGASVTNLVVSDTALYVAHTNADVAEPGVCDAIAAALALKDIRGLSPHGDRFVGRVGRLPEPSSLRDFAEHVARALPATAGGVRVAGPPGGDVRTVAVVGGSGDDQFDAVRASGADVYLTADLRHHPVLEAREEARGGPPYLIDAGHWATEWLWLGSLRDTLLQALGADAQESGAGSTRVEVSISTLRTEPWTFVVGANAAGGS